VVLVPAVWVLAEAVRSVPVLGGPWAVLGLTQWNAPLLGGAAALDGVWLLGLLVVAVNVALTAVVAPPGGSRGARLCGVTGAAALLGVAALGGWVALGGGARVSAYELMCRSAYEVICR
jgi:apolipoprotein N-acyltransferase